MGRANVQLEYFRRGGGANVQLEYFRRGWSKKYFFRDDKSLMLVQHLRRLPLSHVTVMGVAWFSSTKVNFRNCEER